jgi:hypothetical protein
MPPDSQIQAISAVSSLVGCVIGLAAFAFGILIYWKIFSKAGYSGARSLLLLIPIVNLVIICMFAFGEWPIQQELNRLRQQGMPAPGYGAYPQGPGPQGPYPQNPGYPPNSGYPQNPGYPQY